MTVTIVGSQFGDEGKGGIVDVYGEGADVVVRYQGGDNAGHTVVSEGEEYKLSLVPSGVVRGKVGLLGNGCVVNPATLFEEIDALRERGLDAEVRVAARANVILPYHRVLDSIEEDAKSESDLAAGTTGRGIGPTYEDKVGRRGIRAVDLLDPDRLREKLAYVVPQKRTLAREVYGLESTEEEAGGDGGEDGTGEKLDGFSVAEAFDPDALADAYAAYGERLAAEEMVVDAGDFLTERLEAGAGVMFEGAQGTFLDIDHGNYPYVTSSNPTAGYAATGTGVGPTTVGRGEVVGIVKAYLSRVGTGPMPTELGGVEGQTPGYDAAAGGTNEETATRIRDEGGEYGTVTGRPRRVGWLDVPVLRHAARTSGFTGFALNHLDVLAGFEEVKVGDAYERDGERLLTVPPSTEAWGECEAVYRRFDGWPEFDAREVVAEGYGALPAAARDYVEYLEEEMGADAYALGLGPGREETLVRTDPW
jgi:adenylosuccinate synthase